MTDTTGAKRGQRIDWVLVAFVVVLGSMSNGCGLVGGGGGMVASGALGAPAAEDEGPAAGALEGAIPGPGAGEAVATKAGQCPEGQCDPEVGNKCQHPKKQEAKQATKAVKQVARTVGRTLAKTAQSDSLWTDAGRFLGTAGASIFMPGTGGVGGALGSVAANAVSNLWNR